MELADLPLPLPQLCTIVLDAHRMSRIKVCCSSMQTWNNLADALIQLAQALSTTQRLQEAEEAVARARTSYQCATSLSSSEDGDDLPGLLCNWGSGLTAVGGMLRDSGASGNAVEVLWEAVRRLDCSLDFRPSDIQVRHSATRLLIRVTLFLQLLCMLFSARYCRCRWLGKMLCSKLGCVLPRGPLCTTAMALFAVTVCWAATQAPHPMCVCCLHRGEK